MLISDCSSDVFSSDLLGTHFEVSAESVSQLRRLAAALRARGSQLVIVPQAPRGLMDSDKLTATQRKHYDLGAAKRSFAQALAQIRQDRKSTRLNSSH